MFGDASHDVLIITLSESNKCNVPQSILLIVTAAVALDTAMLNLHHLYISTSSVSALP